MSDKRFVPYAPFIISVEIDIFCICGERHLFMDEGITTKTCSCGRAIIVSVSASLFDLDGERVEI